MENFPCIYWYIFLEKHKKVDEIMKKIQFTSTFPKFEFDFISININEIKTRLWYLVEINIPGLSSTLDLEFCETGGIVVFVNTESKQRIDLDSFQTHPIILRDKSDIK
jgi:hypothetical protein